MNPYDIERIFAEIEESIIKRMIDNFRKIRAKGKRGSYKWQDWRVRQLKAIKDFMRDIKADHEDTYKDLNKAINDNIEESFDSKLEASIERAVDNARPKDLFFRINRTRMETLQKSTTEDLSAVEGAVFRRTEDAYRQIIYKAQVALNSGTVTYDQAVDMATRDFLNSGINCIVYSNGSRHTVQEYAKMVLRTSMKRAGLMADGEVRKRLGVNTVYAHWRDEACPECMQFLGILMIDDVYSNGTKAEAEELGCITLSEAMAQGFLHPNCKDTVATYFPYLWEDDPEHDPLKQHANKRTMYEAKKREEAGERLYNAEVNVKKYGRLAENQLDYNNEEKYKKRTEEWVEILNERLAELGKRTKKLTLETIENSIRDKDIEYLVSINNKGRVVYTKTSGLENAVYLDDLETLEDRIEALADKTVTHNHPGGSTFSSEDVALAFRNGIKEMRACHRGGEYILTRQFKRAEKIPENYFNFAQDYKDAYNNYIEEVTDTEWERAKAAFEKGLITESELQTIGEGLTKKVRDFRHNWLKDNSADYGWKYRERKNDE